MSHHQDNQLSHRIVKATTAVTVGGSSMVLSSLALAATVMGLVVATPLMLIFSPVLVPAVVATLLITGGFLATGGFGATATFLFYWMYKYVTGKRPVGAENVEHLRDKIGSGVAEVKGQAEILGQQIVKSGQEGQPPQHHRGQGGEEGSGQQDIEIKGEEDQSGQQHKAEPPAAAAAAAEQRQDKGGQEEKKQSKSGKKKKSGHDSF